MRIGVDLSMLVYQGSGVATFTFQLAKSLLKYDKNNTYVFFYSSLRRPPNFPEIEILKGLGANIISLRFPSSFLRLVWNRYHLLPIEIFTGKVDLFLSSDYLRPPLSKRTIGATVLHDVTWKKFPEFHTNDVIEAHKRKLNKTIKYNDLVITDSNSSRQDLLEEFPSLEKERIKVIPLGVDESLAPSSPATISKVKQKYKIAGKYFVYIGAIEPRKNLIRAIEVFREAMPVFGIKTFVIAGRAGWKNKDVYAKVIELGIQENVRFVGYVDEDEKSALYSGAEACLYLSLYEGFGLPPLEAAACGTPSLIYRNSSLSELFPPTYPYAEKMKELIALRKLLKMDRAIFTHYAKKFSWRDYVKKFATIASHEISR